MKDRLRLLDLRLMVPMTLLIFMGILTVYSAGRGTPNAHLWIKQVLWNILGFATLSYIAGANHRRIFHLALPLYLLGLASLGVVLVIGKAVAGSKSWIAIGGVTLQPSEFVKWLTLLYVSVRLGTRNPMDIDLKEWLGCLGLVSFPMLLVLKQPDLGVALTFLPILLLLPLLRGLSWRWMGLGFISFSLFCGWAWQFKLKPYQKERILTFLDPGRDLKGKGFQVHQSRIAIGAGGILGQGFTSGSQTQLNFLPVKTTDFAFSVWAEERGFLGVLAALGLFGLVLKRLLEIAQAAKTASGTYFAFGTAGIFGIHILVNAGMVVGALPTTGIPLPFFTYGGSSTLAFFLALGVVLNIQQHARVR